MVWSRSAFKLVEDRNANKRGPFLGSTSVSVSVGIRGPHEPAFGPGSTLVGVPRGRRRLASREHVGWPSGRRWAVDVRVDAGSLHCNSGAGHSLGKRLLGGVSSD